MIRRISLVPLVLGLFASLSFGNYHFVHFNSRTAPWRSIPEKFDLSSLPNKTLSYYVTDQTGITLASNDTYVGLMSEIRSAAKVWNDVETSELRLAFGGFAAPNTPQSTPSLEIIFGDDIPPGLIALGGPQVLQVNLDSTGQFVPIQKSVVLIRPDLSTNPSFSERFFGTLVHEIGHGLGLQHTFTSGVMATRVTRSTGRSKPLTSDDIAGLSLLYPTSNFAQNTGSITGRVTQSGAGVNLASVVAVSPSGAAVSTLTNPDGTYRIDGLPPRAYYVYVHPLPPAQQGQATPGDIVFPRDSDGRSLGPGTPFLTIFYPGTNDASQAFTISPAAGSTVQNIDFAVRGRTGSGIHSVDTYAFPDAFAVKPAYLSPSIVHPFLVASGAGLFSGASLAQGLSVTVLGGPTLSVRPYSPAPTSYVQIDFDPRTLSIAPESPRHLVFSQNGDIYVLPAAFFHVEKLPPSVTSVLSITDGPQRLAVVNGTNLADGSQVYFDGVLATIRDSDILGGRLTVIPPAAPPNHRASVVVLNPDGQSSLFIQGDTPSTYSYSSDLPGSGVSLSLPALPAGTEAMLQIDSPAGSFVDGQTIVGFGTSDIQIRQVSVVSPTRLLVNVALSPTAQPGFVQLSVVSGLQLLTQQFAFQITSPTRAFWLSDYILNAQTGLPGVSAGMQAILTVGGIPGGVNLNNATLVMDDRSIPITSVANNQITFQVPASASSGPAVLRVEATGERSWPILMLISPPPPKAQTAVTEREEPTSASQPAL